MYQCHNIHAGILCIVGVCICTNKEYFQRMLRSISTPSVRMPQASRVWQGRGRLSRPTEGPLANGLAHAHSFMVYFGDLAMDSHPIIPYSIQIMIVEVSSGCNGSAPPPQSCEWNFSGSQPGLDDIAPLGVDLLPTGVHIFPMPSF